MHITSHGTKFTYGAFAEETGAESEQRAVRMELAIEEAVSYTRTSQCKAVQLTKFLLIDMYTPYVQYELDCRVRDFDPIHFRKGTVDSRGLRTVMSAEKYAYCKVSSTYTVYRYSIVKGSYSTQIIYSKLSIEYEYK